MISALSPLAGRRYALVVLLSGHAGVAVATLARNILLARILGAEQFGIAASFAIVISAIEMATTLGAQNLIIREPNGDKVSYQAWLHLVQVARGILGCIAILCIAAPIAQFLQIPEATTAIRCLAVCPLFIGFAHLDPWRYQRNRQFGASVCVQLAPALLAMAIIWPLHSEYHDFRLVLIVTLVNAGGVFVMSHLLAERRYQWSFDTCHLRQTLRFGMPLALNGLMLIATFHGEKLIVGHVLGPASLAIIAMGFTLTLTPALIAGKSLQSYLLPALSTQSLHTDGFVQNARSALILCFVAGVILMIALVPLSWGVATLLGPEFAPLMAFIPVLAAIHGIRVIKTGPAVIALAKGDSFNTVYGNLPRIVALPIIYLALSRGADLQIVLLIALIAEAAGCAAAFAMLRRDR